MWVKELVGYWVSVEEKVRDEAKRNQDRKRQLQTWNYHRRAIISRRLAKKREPIQKHQEKKGWTRQCRWRAEKVRSYPETSTQKNIVGDDTPG